MDKISFYSGYDHASLLRRVASKAKSFDVTKPELLAEFKIRIEAVSSSVTQSNTRLKDATTQLLPVLHKLCLLIQQIVFWCLGITTLADSITSKQQAIQAALDRADKDAVLKIFPLATTYDQGEPLCFTIEYCEHKQKDDKEDNESVIVDEPLFTIRFEGEEVMSVKPEHQALSVKIIPDRYIPNLIQIAIELAQRENVAWPSCPHVPIVPAECFVHEIARVAV